MSQPTTQIIRAKYRLSKNTFVTCYLGILEASGQEIKTFLGLKKRADTSVPIGTKIFFDGGTRDKISMGTSQSVELFSITVQRVEEAFGRPLHICTPIDTEVRPEQRAQSRLHADFPVRLAGKELEFTVRDGNTKGLTLVCRTKRAMLSLLLNKPYDFTVHYKDTDYDLAGIVKHIQYDWKDHEHIVGIHLPALNEEKETILHLLLDPNYSISIRDRQRVDTAEGKISMKESLGH
jgi:hypothetical protein